MTENRRVPPADQAATGQSRVVGRERDNDATRSPVRVRLSRAKGARKPEGAVVVARPSIWGNPYRVTAFVTRGSVVAEFRDALEAAIERPWSRPIDLEIRNIADRIEQLRGRDLACWCPLDEPCHADVLLEMANR